jgi:hypothetical protein
MGYVKPFMVLRDECNEPVLTECIAMTAASGMTILFKFFSCLPNNFVGYCSCSARQESSISEVKRGLHILKTVVLQER